VSGADARQHYVAINTRRGSWLDALGCSGLLVLLALLTLDPPLRWWAAAAAIAAAPLWARFLFAPRAVWLEGPVLVQRERARCTRVPLDEPVEVFTDLNPTGFDLVVAGSGKQVRFHDAGRGLPETLLYEAGRRITSSGKSRRINEERVRVLLGLDR
jgi:hypothetical protein